MPSFLAHLGGIKALAQGRLYKANVMPDSIALVALLCVVGFKRGHGLYECIHICTNSISPSLPHLSLFQKAQPVVFSKLVRVGTISN